MLVTMLRIFLLAALFAERAISQYITRHPLGALSYNHFQQTVGYNYISPSGQMVNVKFSTLVPTTFSLQSAGSSLDNPHRIVLHSGTTALPFSTRSVSSSRPGFSFFHASRPGPAPSEPGPAPSAPDNSGRPAPVKALFVRAQGVGPVESEKQLQAYKDYVKQLAEEDSAVAVSEGTANLETKSSSFSSYKSVV